MTRKQDVGLTRNTIDKYYTSSSVVEQCMEFITKYIDISSDDLCIEPSAGNGSFIKYIKQIFTNYKFYDLEPDHGEIVKQDYLKFKYENSPDPGREQNDEGPGPETRSVCRRSSRSSRSSRSDVKEIETQTQTPRGTSAKHRRAETRSVYNKVHIIGNPPFGRQSSLAIKFIKKSCEYCDSISFILPKSFKKESMKKHFPLNFHLLYEYDLPDNSFIVDGKIHDVPCVFQIWEKKHENRISPKILLPKKYKFVKREENPDITFRRVGVNAGNIDKEIKNKSVRSHYFIKFDDKLTEELFQTLSKITHQCKNHTVGPKSISKQELIKEFNVFF